MKKREPKSKKESESVIKVYCGMIIFAICIICCARFLGITFSNYIMSLLFGNIEPNLIIKLINVIIVIVNLFLSGYIACLFDIIVLRLMSSYAPASRVTHLFCEPYIPIISYIPLKLFNILFPEKPISIKRVRKKKRRQRPTPEYQKKANQSFIGYLGVLVIIVPVMAAIAGFGMKYIDIFLFSICCQIEPNSFTELAKVPVVFLLIPIGLYIGGVVWLIVLRLILPHEAFKNAAFIRIKIPNISILIPLKNWLYSSSAESE